MAKKPKLKIISLSYENQHGEQHSAKKAGNVMDQDDNGINSVCTLGQKRCQNGKIFRCMSDPWGELGWWETSEKC